MLLKLTHTTDLSYSDLVNESVMELRMAPRQEQDQHRLSFALAIGPATQVTSYFDWLGNTVHTFTIGPFHKQIRIVATSVVETDRPRPEVQRFSDIWPLAAGASDDYALYDYLHFGGPIVDVPPLHALARVLQPTPGLSLGELALRMLHLMNEKFIYKTGITSAASPITDMLDSGAGVCQDFTHLMIGLARALGIPARYVSGLIHPDAERYRGFTQTHAWCELYFPSAGWVGFDPANNCIIGANFVKVAVGRDFRDVPPNKGLYRGNAQESIDVKVQSEELRLVPAELAAERVLPLGIPTYPAGFSIHREMAEQQVEVQQQQQ
ncbi:MAG TPA: transglutaminase family protein [Tepidisphaeraceae bacterium]|nr:transglutaminase family protein [Tepidisphaeraceae bacterium]